MEDVDLDTILSLVDDVNLKDRESRIESGGREEYAPGTYEAMLDDAVASCQAAIDDGFLKLEIQLPPPPGFDVDSSTAMRTNLTLCIELAKRMASQPGGRAQRVHVLVADRAEFKRAGELFETEFGSTIGQVANTSESSWRANSELGAVTLGTLAEVDSSALAMLDQTLTGDDYRESVLAGERADILICTNLSCVELLLAEKYARSMAESDDEEDAKRPSYWMGDAEARRARPFILFQNDLESLRGDMGLSGFPDRDLHHRFTSEFLPAFFLRKRDYNKTVATKGWNPLAIEQVYYSGALFREYPGPWQVLKKESGGVLKNVATRRDRFKLREVKQMLKEAFGLSEEEGSTDQLLRGEAGAFWEKLKPGTWWEQEESYGAEASSNWRR